MTKGKPFRWPVRVYYEDTDAAGVVYYANYLRFLERARTEWLASLGFTLTALEAEHGVVFVVHRLDIEYRRPARLYDALDVTLRPARRRSPGERPRDAGLPRPSPLAARTDSRGRFPKNGGTRLNLHPDLSFVAMMVQASVVVQAVMALLFLASLWSWWQIFLKLFALKRAARDTDRFEDEFWKGGDLNELFQRASQNRGGALERVFSSGFREYAKHRRQGTSSAATMDSARRAMRASYQREIDALEANLSGLATVGSVSPYVGLFGTVWGIMNAFRGLQNVSQATLAQVAPGIAEALIATAIGLFAAIPAVVAYNRYTHDVDRLATRFETFIEEFTNILQRQV